MNSNKKVFLLGLDGMTSRLEESYVKTDLLPNIKKIMEQDCVVLSHRKSDSPGH